MVCRRDGAHVGTPTSRLSQSLCAAGARVLFHIQFPFGESVNTEMQVDEGTEGRLSMAAISCGIALTTMAR